MPFGVLPPGYLHQYRPDFERINVSIAFRRSAPRLLRLPNCLAGRGRRAVQVTTAIADRYGLRWPLTFRGDNIHKVLRFGELKFRSRPPWFSWGIGPDLGYADGGLGRSGRRWWLAFGGRWCLLA